MLLLPIRAGAVLAKWAGWCVLAAGPAALNDNRSRAVDRIVGYQGLGLGAS